MDVRQEKEMMDRYPDFEKIRGGTATHDDVQRMIAQMDKDFNTYIVERTAVIEKTTDPNEKRRIQDEIAQSRQMFEKQKSDMEKMGR